MFKWLSSIKPGSSSSSTDSESAVTRHGALFSVAVLLTEIMHADHHLCSCEKSVVTRILVEQYAMSIEAASKLFEDAEKTMQGAVSLHEHTSLVNSSFNYKQKLELINSLWQVAFADEMLDRYEEHLIRRLADLLHVSHRDFIKEKHAVLGS